MPCHAMPCHSLIMVTHSLGFPHRLYRSRSDFPVPVSGLVLQNSFSYIESIYNIGIKTQPYIVMSEVIKLVGNRHTLSHIHSHFTCGVDDDNNIKKSEKIIFYKPNTQQRTTQNQIAEQFIPNCNIHLVSNILEEILKEKTIFIFFFASKPANDERMNEFILKKKKKTTRKIYKIGASFIGLAGYLSIYFVHNAHTPRSEFALNVSWFWCVRTCRK